MAQRTVRALMVPHVTPALDIESTFDIVLPSVARRCTESVAQFSCPLILSK